MLCLNGDSNTPVGWPKGGCPRVAWRHCLEVNEVCKATQQGEPKSQWGRMGRKGRGQRSGRGLCHGSWASHGIPNLHCPAWAHSRQHASWIDRARLACFLPDGLVRPPCRFSTPHPLLLLAQWVCRGGRMKAAGHTAWLNCLIPPPPPPNGLALTAARPHTYLDQNLCT